MPSPATVICTYRVKSGSEDAFRALLDKHWPTLRDVGLATDDPPLVFLGRDASGPVFTEIFSWVDDEAPRIAHETPGVMSIWEPMGALCESRGGREAMEFPHVLPVRLSYHSR